MIINIRGTSGSGKTHLARQLMGVFDGGTPDAVLYGSHGNFKHLAERYPQKSPKVIGYSGTLSYPPIPPSTTEVPHFVSIVGKYETACGGCDTIKTQDEICDRVRAFATRGDVVFEGLLVSVLYERYAKLADEMLDTYRRVEPVNKAVLGRELETFPPFIFAFLDTPVEVCVERVKARRLAAGNDKPLNEDNTREKWDICQRVAEKFKAAGYPVVHLNHEAALDDLTTYLKGTL